MIRILLTFLFFSITFAQETGSRMSLLFMGDVMGHIPQVEGAYNADNKQYDYMPLAAACRDSGIDVLVTANNHTCDRGKKGIIRTLNVLDSLKIAHTGTFRNKAEFDKKNLLVLSKNGISVGILNYTYGTNGLPVPEPTVVNRIDFNLMKQDIEKAKKAQLDKLIVVIHWGIEYQQKQNKNQEEV